MENYAIFLKSYNSLSYFAYKDFAY